MSMLGTLQDQISKGELSEPKVLQGISLAKLKLTGQKHMVLATLSPTLTLNHILVI